MNYVTAKVPSDIKLEGIKVHFEKNDDILKIVTLRDAKGSIVRFVGEYSAAKVQVPAPPKEEDRYVLRGEVPVIGAVEKVFEHKHEADAAKFEFESSIRVDSSFTITKEKVVVDEPTTDDGSIPF